MSLAAGTRLGPYEVVSAIGAGGMGEVYRARDTKLGREVALKILPDAFAWDPDRRARFEREAKTLAALNHPHIAQIHGFEQAEASAGSGQDVAALVLELVEGQTLAERIAEGPLPLEEALPVARQIAEALLAAHEAGIIHRDLKPANIKVRPDGTVKVLDFGLAKALDPAGHAGSGGQGFSPGGPGAANSPTLSLAATQAGLILGTAAYMAPEQARGKPADKRADVWAFGCVLYELLTGRRAFEGEDVSDTLAAVLRGEPDWGALPRELPPHVDLLLKRCLQKERKARVGDMAVVRFLLDEDTGLAKSATQAPPPRKRLLGAFLAGGIVASAIGAGVLFSLRTVPEPALPMRFAIAPPAAQPLALGGGNSHIAVAPDGQYVAYRVMVDGVTKLAVRHAHELEARVLDGTEGAQSPFVSPDGRWIGFASAGVLKKIPVSGGPPTALCPVAGAMRGASWFGETIVFATADPNTGLFKVPAGGGEAISLTKPDHARGEADHHFPSVLPNGRVILFSVIPPGTGASAVARIGALDLDSLQYTIVLEGGSQAQYVASGHLVFATSGTLRAVPFDPATAQLTGEPAPVLERLHSFPFGGAYAISGNGMLVYAAGGTGGGATARVLKWLDERGREESIAAEPRGFSDPRLSPDERQVVVEVTGETHNLWMLDLARGTLTRQTFSDGADETPAWSPDGRWLAYASTRPGVQRALYRRRADGSGDEEQLWTGISHAHVDEWTPDGRALLVSSAAFGGAQSDLFLLTIGERELKPLLTSPFSEAGARLSPDGRSLAYYSNESGRTEVYVRSFPALEGKVQISTGGGSHPVWSRRGDRLFYRGDGAVMAVSIRLDPSFTPGTPQQLFDDRLFATGHNHTPYDVSRDGRLLVVQDTAAAGEEVGAPATLTVVLNWFEELKRLVPRN